MFSKSSSGEEANKRNHPFTGSLFGQPILPVRKCVPYVQDVRWLVNGAPSKISNQCRFNRDIEGYLKPGAIHRWIKNFHVSSKFYFNDE